MKTSELAAGGGKPTKRANAPVLLFVHGGRWRPQPDNAFVYFADTVVNAGVHLAAARAGDDYELLFALPAAIRPPVRAIPVGRFAKGKGLTLTIDGVAIPLPDRLGWEHG